MPDHRRSPTGIFYEAPERGEPQEPAYSGVPKPARPAPPARQPDAYAIVAATPEMVLRYRPRWSLDRARHWLTKHELRICEIATCDIGNTIRHLLSDTTGNPLRRDQDDVIVNRPPIPHIGESVEFNGTTFRIVQRPDGSFGYDPAT